MRFCSRVAKFGTQPKTTTTITTNAKTKFKLTTNNLQDKERFESDDNWRIGETVVPGNEFSFFGNKPHTLTFLQIVNNSRERAAFYS